MGRPLVAELVGMFPENFRLCHRSVAACGVSEDTTQRADYPPDVQEQGLQAQLLYERLLADFGGRVMPVSVSVTSPRGLWLTVRHRLPAGQVSVVVGGRALPLSAGYEAIRKGVEERLQRTTAPA